MASITCFDDNAATDSSEAAQVNVRGTQRVKLMTQLLWFDLEDSADRIEGEKIVFTFGVDPLPHFIARSLMGTAAGSRSQHATADRIFQYREEKPGLTIQMTPALALVVILTRCHRKGAFLAPAAEVR